MDKEKKSLSSRQLAYLISRTISIDKATEMTYGIIALKHLAWRGDKEAELAQWVKLAKKIRANILHTVKPPDVAEGQVRFQLEKCMKKTTDRYLTTDITALNKDPKNKEFTSEWFIKCVERRIRISVEERKTDNVEKAFEKEMSRGAGGKRQSAPGERSDAQRDKSKSRGRDKRKKQLNDNGKNDKRQRSHSRERSQSRERSRSNNSFASGRSNKSSEPGAPQGTGAGGSLRARLQPAADMQGFRPAPVDLPLPGKAPV